MDKTLTDRLPDGNVETLDSTMAEAVAEVLVNGLTDRLAVAKFETLTYTLDNKKSKALVDTLTVKLAEVYL